MTLETSVITTQASTDPVHAVFTGLHLDSQPYRIVPIGNIIGFLCSVKEREHEKINLCPEVVSARQVTSPYLSSTGWRHINLIQEGATKCWETISRNMFLLFKSCQNYMFELEKLRTRPSKYLPLCDILDAPVVTLSSLSTCSWTSF